MTEHAIRERAETALARADALGEESARIFLALDRERILRDAEDLDARLAAGERPPLAGLACSIKDLVDRAGERTTAGSRLLAEAAPATADAPIVKRLAAAGALVFGRTSLTEFAYSGVGMNPHHGTPGCVFDASRIPGGSSSGAALSVARGVCDVAIGTDTGGSVRIPAAVNGLVGLKPTASLVPTAGVHALSDSMDSVGPLAPDLDTALATLAALADDASLADPASGTRLGDLRLGVPAGWLSTDLEPAVERAWRASLERLADAGVALVEIELGWLGEVALANRTIVSVEAYAHYRDALGALETIGDPHVLERIRFAEGVDEAARERAYATREASIERFGAALADVDALLAPTPAVVPPTIAAARADFTPVNASMLRNCSAINFVDGCAATLPVAGGDGYPEGMPGALMIAAPRGADRAMLAVTRAVDAAVGTSARSGARQGAA